jgi:hypothetical protein
MDRASRRLRSGQADYALRVLMLAARDALDEAKRLAKVERESRPARSET